MFSTLLLILFLSFIWAMLITLIYKSNLRFFLKIVLIFICLYIIFIHIKYCIFAIAFLPITFKYLFYSKNKIIFTICLLVVFHIDNLIFNIQKEYYCSYKKEYKLKIIDNNYTMNDLNKLTYIRNKNPDKLTHNYNFYDIVFYIINNNEPKETKIAKFYGTYIPEPFVFRIIDKHIFIDSNPSFGYTCGTKNIDEITQEFLKDNYLKNLK